MSELKKIELLRENLRVARLRYPNLPPSELKLLSGLTRTLGLSLLKGEILCIDGKWYVTYGGLLRIAFRHHCKGIVTVLQEQQSDPLNGRWIFKATVYKSRGSRGFTGYGDADPTNVSSLVRGAEMRVAETRAVNRALRKACGIGLCSVEELGALPTVRNSSASSLPTNGSHSPNGN